MVITNSSTLNGRYVIQSVLGEVGPFDVTYLAWDLQAEHEVVLREYYPLQFSKRAADGLTLEVNDPRHFEYGLGAYTAEAHRLTDLYHPNVLNVKESFKENGTIYTVVDHIPGASAYGYMTQQGGALTEEMAYSIMESILNGLQYCHDNKLYHGGIWPKAIHLTPEGKPILMGFSQARFHLARHSGKLDLVRLPGFTAPEQSDKDAEAGPWWDIFGCAATFFYILSGYQLSYQRDRFTEADVKSALHKEGSISAGLRPVLQEALAFDYKNRPASIQVFQEAFEEAIRKKTLLMAHTNGHSSDGASYSTSISAQPASPAPSRDEDDAIIDVKTFHESKAPALPPEPEPEPLPQAQAHASIDPTISAVNHITNNGAENGHLTEADQQAGSNTPVRFNPDAQAPAMLVQEQQPSPQPKETGQKSEKEVAQLLSRMVKWQQRLIAFILAFTFMVILVVIGIFAGPQLMEALSNPSGQSTASTAGTSLSNASAATGLDSEMYTDSSGTVYTQADIDSMYASIRSQLEAELGAVPVSTEPSSLPNALQIAPPRTTPDTDNTRNTVTQSPPVTESRDDAPETGASPQAGGDAESEPETADAELASNAGEATEEDAPADSAGTSGEAELTALLQEREYHMYRSMGDSLMNLGLDNLALRWYQSALQNRPGDTYTVAQIEKIQSERERIEAELAAEEAAKTLDSLQLRRFASADSSGVFFAPDTQPELLNRDHVYASLEFPAQCQNRTSGGRVLARTIVDEEGNPSQAAITKGLHPSCDQAVLDALLKGDFEPATFNGEPVKAWFAFRVEFTFE